MSHPEQQPLQPLLHDAAVVLSAPTQVWSDHSGRMSQGIHGVYHSDTRVFGIHRLTIGGKQPEHISTEAISARAARFVSLARNIDDSGPDPRVRVEVLREAAAGVVSETITVRSARVEAVETRVELSLGADFAELQVVKAGLGDPTGTGTKAGSDGAESHEGNTVRTELRRAEAGDTILTLSHAPVEAVLSSPDAEIAYDAANAIVTLAWNITIPARSEVTLGWSVTLHDSSAVVAGAPGNPEWADITIESDDSRLGNWVTRALEDLDALRMTTTARPNDPFLAAGAPWFFTLFGRDSIWAARMLLPLGTELAASTLRVLASLQGTTTVNETAEQPGKIMHELRPGDLVIPVADVSLPPLYYGTVDATALWVCLLVDAWRWGLAEEQVQELLPNMVAALTWMRDFGDSDGDGFLEYVDLTGHGLANQGWKDSGDSVQWQDGKLAEGPIALCEVQAYAYEAAAGAAEILEHFGRGDEAATWRDWAQTLAERFRESFWIPASDGAYPAIALDAQKRPVDTVTSNIGHILGTGLLNPDEEKLIAARLVSPELNSGFGLRTMSTEAAGFWPLSYHGGSVWAHDTAIAIQGLTRSGFHAEAAELSRGLLAVAEAFDYRMPELHSGDSRTDVRVPAPYPAACRPQAWSSAAAVAVLSSALDLTPANAANTLASAATGSLGGVRVSGVRGTGSPM
ncbi:glycogen debranching N-terminal domain-containing protein [Lysinibacter sp. HNR]|uniref:glycogen debranching N-terminal domain-containing protein n=1 Tax=Lysinibacter sp. HNR TaxID=3031408 RepID=UPI0024355ECD|nr:glycogen debranching N-terminal domain-containing protein [Lysinibacter sp. HNR]WGD37501.1 glycogen debranching N-terminal domain-containing protein [Lysinibacter sp. HNR]